MIMGPQDTTQDLKGHLCPSQERAVSLYGQPQPTLRQQRQEGYSVSHHMFWDKLKCSFNFILVLLDYSESVSL